jgi:HEPN domain-containing protein
MKGNLKTTAEVLLLKAASDEAVLSFALVSDSIVGFHAQQAVEKLMKALLTQLRIPYELTHSLNRLSILLESHGELLPATELTLGDLNDFAVEYRYYILPPVEALNRHELIETVRILREHIVGRIAALTALP